ncbi:NAD(P)/FAD-dependent oxidoreductase [Marinihelvus fidelis]|uniref:Pyridine nucleotide-disulfide oxidoreductase domain-containing protein 2 n=1 Tax=Marinihelvus fidelis TaxID=2613842 RepID=A0A5N0T657_9GAMM|nr:NAD(P)/FAD-dependent oxidoreductase [Marinihelvus fidelis]KAA9130535.1 NAD(P)/FAD-dependent oxidoreductase [Marinihelvus fidelis]
MKKYDAIVIGAGHNGIANAAFLQKAGLDVLLVEKNDWIGGASVSRNLHEDWIYSNCSYVCSLLRPEVYRALDLAKYGLQVVPYGGSVTFSSDGDYLGRYTDPDASRREYQRHSPRDADALHRYERDVMRQCRFIRQFLLRTAPDPTSFKPRDLLELLHIGRELWALGEDTIYDTMRFYTMSIADYLDEYFENPLIKAAKAGSGIIGSAMGVMSPGTAYVLLHHAMGDVDGTAGAWGFARGGMGAIANAMQACFEDHGGTTITGASVEQITTRGGHVTGVALANGDEHRADTVVSNMTLPRTFLECMDPKDLLPEFLEKCRNFKIRGSSGKLNIALDGLPEFTALRGNTELLCADMHLVDSIEKLERAYDDWKDGHWSREPYLDMLIPSLTDPTMAPPGKHFMSVFVQYVPPKIEGRDWTDADRDAFSDNVLNRIEAYAPGFRDKVMHVEVRTPRELENEVGLTEGNIFQGELTMDQLLFNRPIPGYAQYRGPVKGLYMCGSSNHPGGGVMAAPGANAAREILRDLRRPNTVPEGWTDD